MLLGAIAARGGLLERLGGVLERLRATAATDAIFDASEAASKRSCIDLKLFRSALRVTCAVYGLLSLLSC